MRSLHPAIGAILFATSTSGWAQDSLCNPCVDPPLREQRGLPGSWTERSVVSPDDMRRLGIISIEEMRNQLPYEFRSLPPTTPTFVEPPPSGRSIAPEPVIASPESIRATEAYLRELRARRESVVEELATIDEQIAAVELALTRYRDQIPEGDDGGTPVDQSP